MSTFLRVIRGGKVVEEPVVVNAWEAVNENPLVFCSYGKSPSEALDAMSKILRENSVHIWTAANTEFDDEGVCYLTIYV